MGKGCRNDRGNRWGREGTGWVEKSEQEQDTSAADSEDRKKAQMQRLRR